MLSFLRFFVRRMLSAPFAIFFVLQFALHFAYIFPRPVIITLADGALHTN